MKIKKRGTYNTDAPRDFPGRGALKCAMCGNPIVNHKSTAFCKGKKKRGSNEA